MLRDNWIPKYGLFFYEEILISKGWKIRATTWEIGGRTGAKHINSMHEDGVGEYTIKYMDSQLLSSFQPWWMSTLLCTCIFSTKWGWNSRPGKSYGEAGWISMLGWAYMWDTKTCRWLCSTRKPREYTINYHNKERIVTGAPASLNTYWWPTLFHSL